METTIAATPSCGMCGTEIFTIRLNRDKAVLVCISCGAENEIRLSNGRCRQRLSGFFHRLSVVVRGRNADSKTGVDTAYQDLDVAGLTELLMTVIGETQWVPEEPVTDVSPCGDSWLGNTGSWTGYTSSISNFMMRSDKR